MAHELKILKHVRQNSDAFDEPWPDSWLQDLQVYRSRVESCNLSQVRLTPDNYDYSLLSDMFNVNEISSHGCRGVK